jgi:hypothetical protein
MRVAIVIDFDGKRGRANARCLAAQGVSPVELRGQQRSEWIPEAPRDRHEVVVTLGHRSNCTGQQVDVFYTTDFTPEVVRPGEIWIWRSVTQAAPITPAEAAQIIEWAIREGKNPDVRPRCLRRGMGQPTMAAIAVLCQVAVAAPTHELRQREWWVTTFGQTKDELMRQLDLEWPTSPIHDDGKGTVRAFLNQLFEPESAPLLETDDIQACLAAVQGGLREL